MGWCGGTDVFHKLYGRVREYLPEDHRKQFINDLIDALEDEDWDSQYEACRSSWPEVEETLRERGYFEDEEEI